MLSSQMRVQRSPKARARQMFSVNSLAPLPVGAVFLCCVPLLCSFAGRCRCCVPLPVGAGAVFLCFHPRRLFSSPSSIAFQLYPANLDLVGRTCWLSLHPRTQCTGVVPLSWHAATCQSSQLCLFISHDIIAFSLVPRAWLMVCRHCCACYDEILGCSERTDARPAVAGSGFHRRNKQTAGRYAV